MLKFHIIIHITQIWHSICITDVKSTLCRIAHIHFHIVYTHTHIYLWLIVWHLLHQLLAGELLWATGEVLGGVGRAGCYDRGPGGCGGVHHGGWAGRVVLLRPLLGHVGYWEEDEEGWRSMLWVTTWTTCGLLRGFNQMASSFWKYHVLYLMQCDECKAVFKDASNGE